MLIETFQLLPTMFHQQNGNKKCAVSSDSQYCFSQIINMGNIAKVALYLDCLETPWQQYKQPSQDEQQNKDDQKNKSKMQNKHQLNLNGSQTKLAYGQNIQEKGIPINLQTDLSDSIQQKSPFISHELQRHDQPQYQKDNIEQLNSNTNQMGIIELSKIQPTLRAQAQNKIKTLQQKVAKLQLRQQIDQKKNNYTDDTLSHTFGQTKEKYFIGQNEAYQFKNRNL